MECRSEIIGPGKGMLSRILREEEGFAGELFCTYRLLVRRERLFYVSITMGDEEAHAAVGEDFLAAVRIYDSVVRGRVTPITLGDVVQDMRGGALVG